ncbi:hypothetical protein ACTJJ0_21170 [Chitinophaga sp. 22321]|uniref:Baseplate J-like protein n=1 Tax=Chitinophaga hostae TaxID=2831022 RepID=A0ABS5J459_9BACT|nr:hypothetical protein [Chitinophaga hostae]MBS0029999.1 hypothetical protein [Chitinophaga hostae]
MILHCNTLRHPLVHGGTQQRDRLLISLIPEQLELDDRAIEELIAFAGGLSTHVRHWGPDNKEAGDWLPFWESDTTSLLAILAATDLDSPRTAFRSKEILFRRRKKQEDMGTAKPGEPPSAAIMEEMIKSTACGIYGLALTILHICQKIPATHPLKQDIINIISSTLQDPLYRLIQFHKAIDQAAIQQYEGFIGTTGCSAPWGLKDKAAFECINFVLPYEYIDELWSLFLKFYKALSIILEKVKKAFHSSLRSRHDHEPHIALFITFLHLFKYLQQELNNTVEKHLLFYYHDVLRLEKRQLVPDKVHIVFELALRLPPHLITAGTALKAGADAAGVPMTYALTDELVISPVKLVEKKNLYVKDDRANGRPVKHVYSLPAADKRDGLEEEWPEGEKAWRALSGETVYERISYQYRKIQGLLDTYEYHPAAVLKEQQKLAKKLGQLQAYAGFSINSTEFWLENGADRMISLQLTTTANIDSLNLLELFQLDISTEKGLIPLNPNVANQPYDYNDTRTGMPYSFLSDIRNEYYSEISAAKAAGIPPDATYSLYNRVAQVHPYGGGIDLAKKETIKGEKEDMIVWIYRLIIWLHADFPAVLPADENTPPFIRFKTRELKETDLTIQQVEVYSYSGIVTEYSETGMGVLGHLQQPGQPAVFFRENTPGVIESKNQLVMASKVESDVFIKLQELFFKDPGFLYIWHNGDDNLSLGTKSFLYDGGWLEIKDNTGPGIINYVEKEGPLQASGQFPVVKSSRVSGWIKMEVTWGGEQFFVLDANNIVFAYRSNPVKIDANDTSLHQRTDGRLTSRHFLRAFNSLGNWEDLSGNGVSSSPLIPMPEPQLPIGPELFEPSRPRPVPANGNLFLGFEQLKPDQTLSLLFKTAPGTGNPDHYAPDIAWSYLTDNNWTALPPQYILKDTTLGMQQTGIILFQIPGNINNDNTAITGKDGRKDLYWLRASAVEKPEDDVMVDALPMLVDIHVNAAEAVFTDNNNTEEHLINGIPPFTVSALKYRDVQVKTVTQPYASFQGRTSEQLDRDGYITRIHERLRHKDRAVTLWDYERLLLESFPEVKVLKCLPHSRRIYTAKPGHVTVAAIPYPEKMTGNRIFYPIFEAGELTTMKQFLAKRNSYFVGGYGDPGFCCCEDNCQCDDEHDRLDVINARFEPVRIRVCVRFLKGKDIPFYTKALNEALKLFLSPWAKGKKALLFGTSVSRTRLLQFLENLDYVDVVTNLKIKHFSSRQMAEEYEDSINWSTTEVITPYAAASVLTTYLDRLNEDNPNVIDHDINVIRENDRCACGSCEEDRPPTFTDEVIDVKEDTRNVPAPDRKETDKTNTAPVTAKQRKELHDLLLKAWQPRLIHADAIINAMKKALKMALEEKKLEGKIPADARKGIAGEHAYRITPVLLNNQVTAMNVDVAFTKDEFTTIKIDKPQK